MDSSPSALGKVTRGAGSDRSSQEPSKPSHLGSGSVRRQVSAGLAAHEREYWQRLHGRVCGFCDQPGAELRIDHGSSVKECAHRSCWQEREHQYQTPTRIVVLDGTDPKHSTAAPC